MLKVQSELILLLYNLKINSAIDVTEHEGESNSFQQLPHES